MRIAMYGGTFNPPHMGHLAAAESCIRRLKLDRLLLMPAGEPPHKQIAPDSPTAAQRLEMVRLAAALVPGAEACGLELEREGKSYTADTVEQLRSLYPEDDLWLVMGTDMLRTFESWYCPDEILKRCTLLALCRNEAERENMLVYKANIEKNLGGNVIVVENDVLEVSSTDIRTKNSNLIPKSIADYIDKMGLYK